MGLLTAWDCLRPPAALEIILAHVRPFLGCEGWYRLLGTKAGCSKGSYLGKAKQSKTKPRKAKEAAWEKVV